MNRRGDSDTAVQPSPWRKVANEIASFWPGLPFLSYGLWLAWSSISFSGTAWISDTEIDSTALTGIFVFSNLAYGIVCLIAVFLPQRVKKAFDRWSIALCAGAVTSVGCLVILAIGPYYLMNVLGIPLSHTIFRIASILAGAGGAVLALQMGIIYGSIPPRRALLYASLSQFLAAFVFFFIIAMPSWSPIKGAPSYFGMVAFVGLPLLTAMALVMPSKLVKGRELHPTYIKDLKQFPQGFMQLVVLTFILAFATSVVRSCVTHGMAPTDLFMDNNMLMALRIPIAIVLIVSAFYMGVRDLNVGKFYSLIAISVVVAMIFAAVFTNFLYSTSVFIYAAFNLFDIVLWCLFALVVYQKKLSPIVVFGMGRGGYGLGLALGWIFGSYLLPTMGSEQNLASILTVMAVIVLIASVIMFNDRMYENMLMPASEDQPSIQDMAHMPINATDDGEEQSDGNAVAPFRRAIEIIAEEYNLSPREREVFNFLAMGRGSDYIAEQLHVSWNTVRSHTHNIYVKLNVHSREELMDMMEEYKGKALAEAQA